MIADRRLFLTADRRRIVEESDNSAAFLYVAKGDYYDEDDAREKGWPRETLKVVPESKAILEPPENKAIQIPPEVKRDRPRLVRRRRHG